MRARAVTALCLLVGCGRIGFDPLGEDGGPGIGRVCPQGLEASCPESRQSVDIGMLTSLSGDTGVRGNRRDFDCGVPDTPEQSGSFLVLKTGTYRFTTSVSELPVTLAITRGCDAPEIVCETDPSGFPAVELALEEGEEVAVFVEGAAGDCGVAGVQVIGLE